MPEDIHNIQFYEIIAQSFADKNGNGKIDTPKEKSIFDECMKKFDMNDDNKVDESDAAAYKESLSYNAQEKKQLKEWENFDGLDSKPHNSWSQEDIDKLDEMVTVDFLNKKIRIHSFEIDVTRALKYLKKLGKEDLADMYLNLYNKFTEENEKY